MSPLLAVAFGASPYSVHRGHLQAACRFAIVSSPLDRPVLSNSNRAMTLEKNPEPLTQTKSQSEESDKAKETIAGFRMFQAFATDAVERIDALYSNEIQNAAGVETGFHQLDRLTGGFRPGELIIVAGRPRSGRTAFAAQAADHVSRSENSPCAYYTVGVTGEQLASRMLCFNSSLGHRRLVSGNLLDEDWPRLTYAIQRASGSSLYINDSRELSAEQMCESARELATARGPLCAVFVDSFPSMYQLVPEENGEGILKSLVSFKKLAVELACPVIVVAPVKIDPDLRPDKRPLVADIWHGREVDAIADTIVLIHRAGLEQRDSSAPDWVELRVARQPNGSEGTVTLAFDVSSLTLCNMNASDVLPMLVGSEAQVKWANAIREKHRVNNPLSPYLAEQVSAAWWITNRDTI